MSNPWFRMYSDFLEDAKMISLAFEDQRHFIGVLALKSSRLIDQECSQEVMDRLVAQKLWVDRGAIIEVKRRLIEAGLIDTQWQPLAWDKRQFVSDRDPTAAERQRRKRDRDRETGDPNDVTDKSRVTPRDGHEGVTPLDTDTDTDTEIEAKASSSESGDSDCGGAAMCPHLRIIDAYHAALPELPLVVASRWRGSKDAKAMQSRWREDARHQSIEFWGRFFAVVRTNPHWMGNNERGWKADLRWLVKLENFNKVIDRMVNLSAKERAGHG